MAGIMDFRHGTVTVFGMVEMKRLYEWTAEVLFFGCPVIRSSLCPYGAWSSGFSPIRNFTLPIST